MLKKCENYIENYAENRIVDTKKISATYFVKKANN